MVPRPLKPPWTLQKVNVCEPGIIWISFGPSPHRMQLITFRLLPLMYIPPPLADKFPLNEQLVTVVLPFPSLYIPPPLDCIDPNAEFALNEQFVTFGLLVVLNIPPPLLAVFPLNKQYVTVGLLLLLSIPPPQPPPEFPLNEQFDTDGLLFRLYIPPPPAMDVFPLNEQFVTVGLLFSLYKPLAK